MQDLRVIGVESGALLVATDAGSEYRLPVTLSLQSQLRAADPSHTPVTRKVPPRDIQARIRAGRSAEQVADDAGVDLDYVRRFEGPVLAERSFVLETARNVPVSIAGDGDMTVHAERFGDVIDSRLDAAEASGREWSSYKDVEKGWMVHVTYTAQEVEREASWRFDPKKHGLSPQDGDAHTLSRQDGDHTPLVPRLRAVASEPAASDEDDPERFDSGAFELDGPQFAASPTSERTRADGRSAASVAAMNRAPETEPTHNQTADLLEALRRRRGEREAARFDETDSRSAHPSTGSIRVIDVPLDAFQGSPEPVIAPQAGGSSPARPTTPAAPSSAPSAPPAASDRRDAPREISGRRGSESPRPTRARKGRASMPSWDEIVFGARSDDDPA